MNVARTLAATREIQNVVLHPDVLPSDSETLLESARLDVIACDFCEQRNQHVAPSVFRGTEFRVGGFNGAACAAENVEFPRCIETCVVKIVVQGNAKTFKGRILVGSIAIPGISSRTAGGRPQAASSHGAFGAGFAHVRFGNAQIEIGANCCRHQGIQIGVAEIFPPI